MKKVFTSILLLAALSVPVYLSANAWLEGEGDGEQTEQNGEGEEGEGEEQVAETIEVDYTTRLGIDANSWKGASGLCRTQFAPAITTKDGRTAQLAENYQENVNATGDLITQTVTGLANGTYRVSIYANAFYTSGRNFDSDMEDGAEDVCYVFAGSGENRVEEFITAHIATSTTENDLRTLNNVRVTDGTLVVGLGKAKAGTNWHTVQVYEITAIVDKEAYITSTYSALAEVLAKGEAIKAKVPAESEAIAIYDAAIADAKAGFDNRTLFDVEVRSMDAINAAVAAVNAALPALAKAQTADGSDLTVCIANPEINGSDGWTTERPLGGNGPLLGGTSFEYWAGNATNRAEASFDYYQEIDGLPNGLYTVSADMYNSLNGEGGNYTVFAPTSGVYAASSTAEEVKLVDVDGTKLNTYTTDAVVVADGKLRIGVKSTVAPMAARWFVADNFKLTLVRTLDATGLENELANASFTSGETYRVYTEVEGTKQYLNATGYLTDNVAKAATFTFNKVQDDGTLYETGWNLGVKFTNPSLTNGSTGDVVNDGHIHNGGNDRNDWERQVFFLKDGKYAVRATNANSANWGANTYWDVITSEQNLPESGYSLAPAYIWQVEQFTDNRPAAFEKVQSWIADLQSVKGLVKDASKFSSNAKESKEGSYAALLDGDYTTFFHSSWSAAADADHYLQAELSKPVKDFYIYFKKRQQNNYNRPTDIVITASADGESFTNVTEITEGLPTGATPLDYVSGKISIEEPSQIVRFTILATNNDATEGNGHKFFTFSEFYIFPSDEIVDAAIPYIKIADYTDLTDEDVEAINNIDAKIKEAKEAADIAAELADLSETIADIKAQVAATTADEDATAAINTAIEAAENGTYANRDAVAVAKAALMDAAKTYVGVATPNEYLNVTGYYVVNPTALNKEGWEGTDFGDTTDGVCEYWNKAAADFHQTIALPAGSYKLTAIALTRTGMTGKIYAGEKSVDIVTVDKSVANSRSQAANWFAEGNGKNEVIFTLEEAADVVIGLTADAATGDHWTVWAGFTLEKVNPAIAAAEELAHAREQLIKNLAAANDATDVPTDGLFQKTAEDVNTFKATIAAQQAVADNENATIEDINAAIAALATASETFAAAAVTVPAADKTYSFQLKDSEVYMAINEGIKLSDEAAAFSIETVEGGYAIKAGNNYVAMTGTGNNGWTMGIAAEPYIWTINALPDGTYTIAKASNSANLIGINNNDAIEVGTPCYADKSANTGLVNWVIAEFKAPAIVLNAPTFNIEDGTQTEPNLLPIGSTLKINYSADNLIANGVNADDLQVKITVLVSGDLPENQMQMGSTTVHRVMGESFYIPLGETDFPVALKEGYVYQNVAVMAAELVKPATEETEEKTIAAYTGAPIQLHWVGIEKAEEPVKEELELTLDVERYPGMSYGVTEAEVDLTEAKEFLGVDELTLDLLSVVNPDGSEISDYAPYDGWFNAEGVATTWGDNTAINVKFFEAIPNGIYTICDMNGADEVGKTYSVKFALTANGKKVIYTINVTFVEKPVIDLTFADLTQIDTKTVEVRSELGKMYEGLTADVDVAAILSDLQVEALSDVTIYAVQSDGSLDDNYKTGTTDGWRNADGDWQNWGDAAYFYVKADFSRESNQLYEIGGMENKNTTSDWENPSTYTATYAFVKTGTKNAVVLKVTLGYDVPVGIAGIAADIENGRIFNIAGQKTGRLQKGVNIIGGKKILVK